MDSKEMAAAKFTIQRFLATVYADELSIELYKAMKDDQFLTDLKALTNSFLFQRVGQRRPGTVRIYDGAGVDTFKEIKFEYADLFAQRGRKSGHSL